MDSLEAIDAYSLYGTFLYHFTTVLRIPTQLAEDWARAFSRVCKTLITALELPEAPDKNAKVMRAAKWYSAFPQVIWPRWPQNLHILQLRLNLFLNGNYKSLISHWHRDVIQQRRRRRKPSNDTIEARTVRAVSEILDGDISRGLRIIDGKGSAPLDDTIVIEQMIEKHPRAEENVVFRGFSI